MPDEQKTLKKRTDFPEAAQQVKVKQEKFDPEIEAKIRAISIANTVIKRESDNKKKTSQAKNAENEVGKSDAEYNADRDGSEDDDGDSTGEDNDNKGESNDGDSTVTRASLDEDKKSIAPVKSSNEILAELFKVFNAAPPEELLDDESLLKKSHKHKKNKKEKKKKVKREKDLSEGERSDTDSDESNEADDGKEKKSKQKHKKKKKHKHKDEKDKGRSKSKEKDKKDKEKSKERTKNKDISVDKKKDDPKKILSAVSVKPEPANDHRRDSRSHKRHTDSSSHSASADTKKSRLEDDANTFHSHSNDRGRERDRHHEKDRERDKHRERDAEKAREKDKGKDRKHNSFYNGYPEYESSKSRVKIKEEPREFTHKRDNRNGHVSEISLSDEEEDYLKDRHVRGESKDRRFTQDRAKERQHNSFYAGMKRSRSRDRDRDRNRDRERERERNHRGDVRSHNKRNSHSRGRSRSRSRDLGIDKKRLLEIARKNAISMFKRGNLPGCDGMSQEIKDKVLLKMRYGGKTVQDLTDFCKKISNGENLSDLSSDEDSDVDKSGNTKAFHHPFQLKEREPIVMHIRSATSLLTRHTPSEQVKAITMQFPVSSGQQHRMTEAWVPVVPKENLPPLPALPAATQATSIFKTSVVKNVFEKPVPEEQQEPAFKPVQPASEANDAEPKAVVNGEVAVAATTTPAPVPMPSAGTTPSLDASVISKPFFAVATQNLVPVSPPPIATAPAPPQSVPAANTQQTFVPDVPVPSSTDTATAGKNIFSDHSGPQIDVSSIISKRLQAMRRLQDNPMDPEAIKMMYNSQKDMTSWASSKNLPGQFTGSTGANVLSTRELSSGPQAWARRDQLITSRPLTGGMGMQLLQKMGWKPGEGLGRDKTGSLQPLLLDVKLDKQGLVARDDNNGYKQKMSRRRPQNVMQQQQEILGKHPVCLLNELTSKRKWTPPMYALVNEAGPSHSRMFLFSVTINGQIYTPPQGSNTKKEAKLISARHCLQQMGILPM